MEPWRLSVHPIYGAIYRDGEFVQRGAILGLNTEANGVVVAPASGWVRVVRAPTPANPPNSTSISTPAGKEADKDAVTEGSHETRYDYVSVEIWPTNRT